jgi:3-oxoacyl-[acyl-carrier protein] reductase
MREKRVGSLEGRVAIVTGASRGIGRATALALARDGAKVVVNFHQRRQEALEVVDGIEEFGGVALAVQADVGKREAVDEMVEETMQEFRAVDILVNNAGVTMGSGTLMEFKEEEFDYIWNVNVKGVLHCTRAVAPYMMEKKYGKVVNIASTSGLGISRLQGNLLYASSKAAVIILTKRLALELGQYRINVNAVSPGLIRTEMGLGYSRTSAEQDKGLEYHRQNTIFHRIGEPEEIASVIRFLASEESSFITGQIITVDGGRTDVITHSL